MKKYLSYILILCLFLFGFTTYIDLAANYHWTGGHIFDDLTVGPTDEDAEIGLPKASQTGEEEGDFKIKRDVDGNLIIQAVVNGSWSTIGYDATTKSFKIPQVYDVSGSDSFGISDATISSIINTYEVAAADGWLISDVGTNTYQAGEPSYSADQCTGGTAFAEANETYVDQAFDGVTTGSNGWGGGTVPVYLGYDFGEGNEKVIRLVRILHYTYIEAAYGDAGTIYGSNDPTLTSLTQLATWTSGDVTVDEWTEIPFANSTAYRYILWDFTGGYDNTAIIREVEAKVAE